MDVGNGGTHVGTETADQRSRSTFENNDFVIELSGNRCHFKADEASADHDDPLAAFCNLLADAERIVECSQHMDMLVAALFRQAPRRCSGGNNQPAELERVSVGQVDLLVGQTQP